MKTFLVLTFLFISGSMIGWVIELFWRKFFSSNNPEHKWINPGFLTGPYLPLYGFSLTILFMLSFIDVSSIKNIWIQKTILFIIMAICITVLEFIAGIVFIKGMKIKLWDYSDCFGNIQGIVCPKYTFFWYLLSAAYYFLIHPKILNWIYWFTAHIEFSFVVGFFYGIICVDLCQSLNVMTKLRAFAKENGMVLHLENTRRHFRKLHEESKKKAYFWFSMKTDYTAFSEALEKLKNKMSGKE